MRTITLLTPQSKAGQEWLAKLVQTWPTDRYIYTARGQIQFAVADMAAAKRLRAYVEAYGTLKQKEVYSKLAANMLRDEAAAVTARTAPLRVHLAEPADPKAYSAYLILLQVCGLTTPADVKKFIVETDDANKVRAILAYMRRYSGTTLSIKVARWLKARGEHEAVITTNSEIVDLGLRGGVYFAYRRAGVVRVDQLLSAPVPSKLNSAEHRNIVERLALYRLTHPTLSV